MAVPTSRGFELWVIRGGGDEPTSADHDRGWSRLLEIATLDQPLLTDRDVDRVATGPLRLLLTHGGAQRFAPFAGSKDHRFVVGLDGARLYGGRIVVAGTARALRHPVLHVRDSGLTTTLTMPPVPGVDHDPELDAPPALLAHFAAAGKLAPAGAAPLPRYLRRAWTVELTSARPGDPGLRIAAGCIGERSMLQLARGGPPASASPTWEPDRRLTVERADFEEIWGVIDRDVIARLDPQPAASDVVALHARHTRVTVFADRADGSPLYADRSWTSPSTADQHARWFLQAVAALTRRLAPDLELPPFAP